MSERELYAAHGVCIRCNGAGVVLSGGTWGECERCRGTGRRT